MSGAARMTAAQYRAPGARRRKLIRATPVEIDGHRFPSKHEARIYAQQKQREAIGEISDLKVHPRFPLVIDGEPVLIRSARYPSGRKAVYTADLAFFDHIENRRRVLEAKGYDTDIARLRRAVAEAIYRIRVEVM